MLWSSVSTDTGICDIWFLSQPPSSTFCSRRTHPSNDPLIVQPGRTCPLYTLVTTLTSAFTFIPPALPVLKFSAAVHISRPHFPAASTSAPPESPPALMRLLPMAQPTRGGILYGIKGSADASSSTSTLSPSALKPPAASSPCDQEKHYHPYQESNVTSQFPLCPSPHTDLCSQILHIARQVIPHPNLDL